MDIYKSSALKILELYRRDCKASIMSIFNDLTDEDQMRLYSHILEFYGGSFATDIIVKTFNLFEKIVIGDINKIISFMKHNKTLGIETLAFFLISYTSVKLEEIRNVINKDNLIYLDVIYNNLERIDISICKVISNRTFNYLDLNEMEIEKIKNFCLPPQKD